MVLLQLMQGFHRRVQGHESMSEELDLSVSVKKLNKSIIKYLQRFLVPHLGLDLGFLKVFCKIYVYFFKMFVIY